MLQLGAMSGSQFDEVYPAAQGAIHVHATFDHAFRQHSPSLFFGDAHGCGPLIVFTYLTYEIQLAILPLLVDLAVLEVVVHIQCYAVLSILGVLQSSFSDDKVEISCRVRIALAELLEAEAAVPEDLPGDVSRGGDFQAGGHHFQGAPVLVPDQVSDESV